VVGLRVKVLDESTWSDFARLVEKHNGAWGGLLVHGLPPRGGGAFKGGGAEPLGEGVSLAGGPGAMPRWCTPTPSVWCQFGSPDELPRIKRLRAYADGLTGLPDWRITCFFVDKAGRRQGVAAKALEGALREIARQGGGTVESYPEDADRRSVSGSFLHNGTVSMFERQGFTRTRPLGKHHWVVRAVVPAAE